MRIIGIMLVAMLFSCGGSSAETESQTDPAEQTAGAETTEKAWADLTTSEEKGQFMKEKIMPKMTALFQEFDGERYGEFTCASCHGADAADVGFKMPNGLAPLNPEGIAPMFESEEPMAVFMTQKVWPEMTNLLGAAPYNPETHEGFSCLNCHATKQADAES